MKAYSDKIKRIKTAINEADAVLIGAGAVLTDLLHA